MENRSIRNAEQRTQTICLLILSTIGIGVALLYLKQVLVPFVLAAFLTMAVTPILEFMRRKFRMPRGMAIGVTIALASFVLVFLGGLVSTAAQEVIAKRKVYVTQVGALIEFVDENTEWIRDFVESLSPFNGEPSGDESTEGDLAIGGAERGGDGPQPKAAEPNAAGPNDGQALAAHEEDAGSQEGSSPPSSMLRAMAARVPDMFGQAITWVLNSAATLMSQGLLVLIFMMFLITGYRSVEEGEQLTLRHQISARVKEYLRVKILTSMATGFTTYLILRVLGVDLSLVFGLAAFFLNFIPNIGSIVAVLLPVPVVLLAPSTELTVVNRTLAILLPATVQFLVGSVLEPRWMGKSLDLNPVVILMALMFWGVLWGPIGMLLSVPITAVLKMLLERSDLTQPVASLLSEDG